METIRPWEKGRRELVKGEERDKDAFTAHYREFFPKTFKYVSYRVSDEAAAEDLTSAIFERALEGIATLRSPEALSSWLFPIAHNLVADYYRKGEKSKTIGLEEIAELPSKEGGPLERQVIKQERVQRLRLHLQTLSDREQEIIALKFAGGLKNRQIAEILGLSPGNVGTILYRAMRRLRRRLTEEEV